MSKKYFVFADVHGFYTPWVNALKQNGFEYDNPDHILVSLGDMFDRGNENGLCLKYLVSLPKERTILIRGNHDTMLEELLRRSRIVSAADVYNGVLNTIDNWEETYASDLSNVQNAFEHLLDVSDIKEYYSRLVYYYELGDNIFCHGWLPSPYVELDDKYDIVQNVFEHLNGDTRYVYLKWKNCSKSLWEKATWDNGMQAWADGAKLEGKTIYCGHWHASYGNVRKQFPGLDNDAYKELEFDKEHLERFNPFIDKGIVAMDACTAFSHKVNCIVLEENDND